MLDVGEMLTHLVPRVSEVFYEWSIESKGVQEEFFLNRHICNMIAEYRLVLTECVYGRGGGFSSFCGVCADKPRLKLLFGF